MNQHAISKIGKMLGFLFVAILIFQVIGPLVYESNPVMVAQAVKPTEAPGQAKKDPTATAAPASTQPSVVNPPAATQPSVVNPPAATQPSVANPPAATQPSVANPPAATAPVVGNQPAATATVKSVGWCDKEENKPYCSLFVQKNQDPCKPELRKSSQPGNGWVPYNAAACSSNPVVPTKVPTTISTALPTATGTVLPTESPKATATATGNPKATATATPCEGGNPPEKQETPVNNNNPLPRMSLSANASPTPCNVCSMLATIDARTANIERLTIDMATEQARTINQKEQTNTNTNTNTNVGVNLPEVFQVTPGITTTKAQAPITMSSLGNNIWMPIAVVLVALIMLVLNYFRNLLGRKPMIQTGAAAMTKESNNDKKTEEVKVQ